MSMPCGAWRRGGGLLVGQGLAVGRHGKAVATREGGGDVGRWWCCRPSLRSDSREVKLVPNTPLISSHLPVSLPRYLPC